MRSKARQRTGALAVLLAATGGSPFAAQATETSTKTTLQRKQDQ